MANSDRTLADTRQEQGFSASRSGAAAGAAAIGLPRRVALVLLALDTAGLVLFFNLAFWLRLDFIPWFTPGMLVPLGVLFLSMYVLDTYVLER